MAEQAGNLEMKTLKGKFDFPKHHYYDVTEFTDTENGFSFKKDFNKDDGENVSLFHLLIPNKVYADTNVLRKPLLITAVYGKKTAGGVTLRNFDPRKLSVPIDLEFSGDYFFDVKNGFFYKKAKQISPDNLLEEIYSKHIKPTKIIKGLFLRFKLRFWRIWLPCIFSAISDFFYFFLLLISGDQYTYEFVLQEEKLNGEIISSRYQERHDASSKKPKENEKEAKKLNFFGNHVPQWSIVFYSVIHLIIWSIFKYTSYSTEKIEEFLDSNFLVVLYVIVSFWFVETVLPFISKKLIKFFSTVSARCEFMIKIRV